jgi:hypothetical protein
MYPQIPAAGKQLIRKIRLEKRLPAGNGYAAAGILKKRNVRFHRIYKARRAVLPPRLPQSPEMTGLNTNITPNAVFPVNPYPAKPFDYFTVMAYCFPGAGGDAAAAARTTHPLV